MLIDMYSFTYFGVPYQIVMPLLSNPGVEKNDDAKRNYFSSNVHDPSGEVLKAEGRLDHTS